jgi:hypothetical protein
MAANLNSKRFADYLHTRFAVEDASLELLEVKEGNYSPELEHFAILFRGPLAPFLPQRTYRVEHEKLGSLDIFLVPLGPDEEGMQYEAVFNRIRAAAE